MSILQPRNDHFYQLFERAAANMRRGAEMLLAMLNDYTDVATKAKTIKDVEHDGETLTHEMYELLNRIFVTPLDREDIAALASALDDILVEASADDYVVCGIEAPLPAAVETAQIIVQSAVKVQEAFTYLAHLSRERTVIRDLLEEINRLENEGDDIYRAAMQALFAQSDAVQIVKWKQIYDHMERAVDMCEDVADVLHGVLLKYA